MTDPDQIVMRALEMIEQGSILAVDGETRVPAPAETLLLHGDKPWGLPSAIKLKSALDERGIKIQAL